MRFLVVLVCIAACHESEPTEPACTPSAARAICDENGDALLCGWARSLDDDASMRAIAALLDAPTTTPDDVMTAALPFLEGKTFEEDVAPQVPPPTFTFRSFDPYVVSFPIDWAADPFGNESWPGEFQQLRWIRDLDLDTAAAIVHDYGERALPVEPPFSATWVDGRMGFRLKAVSEWLAAYAASRDVLDRAVVRAAVRIIVTHLYALATEVCYERENNHGMMENAAVLAHVRDLPSLRDGDEIWNEVLLRTQEHIDGSLHADGIHAEHSPAYHILYLGLILDVINSIVAAGSDPPARMAAQRDAMLAGLVPMLQPNMTFAQFGDTENTTNAYRVSNQVALARAQGSTVAAVDQLDWIATDGASGAAPTELDHVYFDGGYASFRDRWGGTDAIVGHLAATYSPVGHTHYHRDEGSFEIYAYGTELIVDSGKYNYDYDDPYTIYQYSVEAHNVVVVDEQSYGYQPGQPRIVDAGSTDGTSWVQAVPDNYLERLVEQVRTFAYARPDTFVVVDQMHGATMHTYEQHIHLAPLLDDVRLLDAQTVLARMTGGPSLVIAVPTGTIELRPSWYFPSFGVVVDNVDVVVRNEAMDPVLPLVITIAAPGAEPAIPTAIDHLAGSDSVTVTWSVDGTARSLTIPR